jgi:hypothetical protein
MPWGVRLWFAWAFALLAITVVLLIALLRRSSQDYFSED